MKASPAFATGLVLFAAAFARAKRGWLRGQLGLNLDNAVPSREYSRPSYIWRASETATDVSPDGSNATGRKGSPKMSRIRATCAARSVAWRDGVVGGSRWSPAKRVAGQPDRPLHLLRVGL